MSNEDRWTQYSNYLKRIQKNLVPLPEGISNIKWEDKENKTSILYTENGNKYRLTKFREDVSREKLVWLNID